METFTQPVLDFGEDYSRISSNSNSNSLSSASLSSNSNSSDEKLNDSRSISQALQIKPLVWNDDIKMAASYDAGILAKHGTNITQQILTVTSLSSQQLKEIRNHPNYKVAVSLLRERYGRLIGDVTIASKSARLQHLQSRHDALMEVVFARQELYKDDMVTLPNGEQKYCPGVSSGTVLVKFVALREVNSTSEFDETIDRQVLTKVERTHFEVELRSDTALLKQLTDLESAAAKEMGQRREQVDVSITSKRYEGFDVSKI